MVNQRPREWSVHPVWVTGAPAMEYAKVRPLEVALGVGRRLELQRANETTWRRGRVVPAPDGPQRAGRRHRLDHARPVGCTDVHPFHFRRLLRVALRVTITVLKIRTFTHAGLRRLYLSGQTKGVPANAVDKLRKMFAFLQDMRNADELRTLPSWDAHRLTGDRKGTWSLTVTRNWRLTFRIENDEILEVNYEDYHRH